MADWTRVQGTSQTTGSGTTTNSLSFAGAVGTGHIVVGGLLLQNSANSNLTIGVVKVTDDQNNTYRIIATGFDGGGSAPGLTIAMFRSAHLINNGPTTIKATTTVNTSVFWMIQDEFTPPTGCPDISLAGQQYMVDDTGTTLPNFQVTDNDSLVWAVSMSTGTSTTGAGFNAGVGSGTNLCSEWAIQTTANNAVSALFATQTGTTWAGALAIAPVAQKRWEPIQRAINRVGTGLTASLSFPNAVGAGHVVIGSIACDANGLSHLTSLLDDQNNSYSLIGGTYNTGQGPIAGDRQTFWFNGLLNNSPTTVTATYNTSQTINFLQMVELAPPPNTTGVLLDGTPTNANNSNASETSTTTPNVITSFNNDVAIGWGDNAGLLAKPGNSFCAINGQSMSWMLAYYNIIGSAGPYNFTCNHGTSSLGNDVSLAIINPIISGPFAVSFYGYGGM